MTREIAEKNWRDAVADLYKADGADEFRQGLASLIVRSIELQGLETGLSFDALWQDLREDVEEVRWWSSEAE